uniref:Glycoside hydrolase family 2 catalytic domain-containing protein n=1 Tax=Emiliania huxleyi TaxID=2903 RepID=A0A7S3S3V9_EMIHU
MSMRGFGRHEDFPLVGRAEVGAVLVRDHACLRWVGANSYRTAHYPYSEVDLDLADEHGLLVVSESPCVGLSFADAPAIVQQRQAQATRALAELLARDCCRTCVVAWSVCNEPGGPQSVPTAEAKRQQTEALLELVALARAEGTRLVTFANIPEHCDEANRACDFLSLNEYVGWYYDVGKPLAEIGRQLEAKFVALEAEYAVLSPNWRERTRLPLYSTMFRGIRFFVAPRLHEEYAAQHRTPDPVLVHLMRRFVALHADFRKPIMVSECGADTLPGCHMMAPGLWSEEFQAGLLEVYTELERKLPFVFGVHVWNLADFRTPQMHLRAAGLNHKGVFTRLREPKLAAHMLRRAWRP